MFVEAAVQSGPPKIEKWKKFAGNMFGKTKSLKEKLVKMIEDSDGEWPDDDRLVSRD